MKKLSAVLILTVLLLPSSFVFAQSTDQVKETRASKITDVFGHWAQNTIEELEEKGVITLSEDEFEPDRDVTRSEFAVMLHKALGIQIAYFKAPDIKDYFTDVKQDAVYASALIDLVTVNILEGKGSFQPEDPLTREEMVHYIMNGYRYVMGDSYRMLKIEPASFKDGNDIKPEYSGDLARAAHDKIVAGKGENLFCPKDIATRAEGAAVISKLLNLLEKESPEVRIQTEAALKEGSLEMKLSISNRSTSPLIFNHSSGLKYDFVLLDADMNVLYKWSADKFFTMMLTTSTIEAGKSLEYVEMLDQKVYKEIENKAVYLKGFLIGSSDSFAINPEGYQIRLK